MTARFTDLIFDLDGTLADTLPLIYEAFNDALEPVTGQPLTPDQVRAMFGPPDNHIIRAVVAPEYQDAAIDRYIATYERRHRELVDLYDGMAGLLTELRAAGGRLAVVTGKSRVTALMTLDMLGVRDRFDAIYAGDDVERQKPDPMAVQMALADLGNTDRSLAVIIGDSAADVVAGKRAGISTIGVLWGSPDHTDLLAAGPDVVCASVADLRVTLGLG